MRILKKIEYQRDYICDGDLTVKGNITIINGSLIVKGKLNCQGDIIVSGDIEAESLVCPGTIRANEIRIKYEVDAEIIDAKKLHVGGNARIEKVILKDYFCVGDSSIVEFDVTGNVWIIGNSFIESDSLIKEG